MRPEAIANPALTYRRLHEHGDPYHCEHRDLWILASYDHVRAALREHAVFSSADGITQLRASLPMMITMDEPEHARLRRLVAPYFTAESASRARPAMERVTDACIDRMLSAPVTDAIAELAIPLPVRVIAAQLGIPGEDFARFREWSDAIVRGFNGGPPLRTLAASPPVLHGVHALHRYLRKQLRHREAGGDDVLSLLLARTRTGELTEGELFWFVLLLLVAGNETTTNLIGSMLLALAEQPDTYEAARANRSVVSSLVAESLRWSSPLQNLFRTSRCDHEVGGTVIPAGARVLVSFAAANRDPNRYPDPDRFVAERGATDHLAFGGGIHFCLGAQLARLEATVVLEALLERVQAIELATEPTWSDNVALRGPTRLPLRLTAAA